MNWLNLLTSGPRKASVRASDNFNRADGALGANWTTLGSGHTIVSNQADGATGANRFDVWAAACNTNDNWSQIAFGAAPVGTMAAAARVVDASNFYSLAYVQSTTTLGLRRTVGGSATTLTSTVTALSSGQVLRIEVQGTALRGYVDGVLVLSTTDATFATGKRVGFRTTSPPSAVKYDNWSGGDL